MNDNEVKCYRITLSETKDIMTGEDLVPPYYKIYAEYDNGAIWYEYEYDTLEEALACTRELYKKRSKANEDCNGHKRPASNVKVS